MANIILPPQSTLVGLHLPHRRYHHLPTFIVITLVHHEPAQHIDTTTNVTGKKEKEKITMKDAEEATKEVEGGTKTVREGRIPPKTKTRSNHPPPQ